MSTQCCNHNCNQGRHCSLRKIAAKIADDAYHMNCHGAEHIAAVLNRVALPTIESSIANPIEGVPG